MPKIRIYDSPVDKLNTEDRGYAAYETAGRRIGPAYDQGAHMLTGSGKLEESAAILQADQTDKLSKQVMEEYRDIWDLGQQPKARGGGGGGGGFSTRGGSGSRGGGGGGGGNFGGAGDISNGATALTSKLTGNKGGKLYGDDPLQGMSAEPVPFQQLINALSPTTDEERVQQEANRLGDPGGSTLRNTYDPNLFGPMLDQTIARNPNSNPQPNAAPSMASRIWSTVSGAASDAGSYVFGGGSSAASPAPVTYDPQLDAAATAASEAQ